MARLYCKTEPRKTERADHIMQWSYRDSRDRPVRRDFNDYIIVLIGNMAAAFNGERLVLARAFHSRSNQTEESDNG